PDQAYRHDVRDPLGVGRGRDAGGAGGATALGVEAVPRVVPPQLRRGRGDALPRDGAGMARAGSR
ncbi:unnamed protein product, partial [Penicillium egyptiacum]